VGDPSLRDVRSAMGVITDMQTFPKPSKTFPKPSKARTPRRCCSHLSPEVPGPQVWHPVGETQPLLKGLSPPEVSPQDLRVAHVTHRLQQSLLGQAHRVAVPHVSHRRHHAVHGLPGLWLGTHPGLGGVGDRDPAGTRLLLQVG